MDSARAFDLAQELLSAIGYTAERTAARAIVRPHSDALVSTLSLLPAPEADFVEQTSTGGRLLFLSGRRLHIIEMQTPGEGAPPSSWTTETRNLEGATISLDSASTTNDQLGYGIETRWVFKFTNSADVVIEGEVWTQNPGLSDSEQFAREVFARTGPRLADGA